MRVRKFYGILMAAVFMAFMSVSCEKDNPVVDNDPDPTGNGNGNEFTSADVNEWIYNWMNTIYFWNNYLPIGVNPANEGNPVSFFYDLVYTQEDRWSFIVDDYEEFQAEQQGNPTTMGYSPAFGRFSNSAGVFIIVEYVIPGSPAELAGLERGDIIVTIDGTELDTLNYRDLYFQDSYTAGLADYDGESTLIISGETVDLAAEVITSSPIIHKEIIDYENKKIGYLVYVDFLRGAEGIFVTQMDEAFTEFANAGVDELIVDLRYNPGGEVSMASYLASSIAPSAVVDASSVLVSYVYNDYLNKLFVDEGGENSSDLKLFFTDPAVNLNMNDVYFMTTSGTASASELVITGLDPYMNVTVVGETTFGKYTGAWVFPDTETPRRHNYAIVPIVLKYANSLGVTEFKNGLDPDFEVDDELLGASPFGNFSDPVLAKTLEVITGVNPAPSTKKAALAMPDYSIIPDIERINRKSMQIAPESIMEPGVLK